MMTTINILVGSTLGGTEYVAEAAQSLLQEAGYSTILHFNPDLATFTFNEQQVWLICLSTHGAGDYPENFKPFVKQVTVSNNDFSSIRFGLIGIGDSNYDSFCFAAINIDNLLKSKGAIPLGELFKIDVADQSIPEDRLPEWIPGWIKDLNSISN